MYNDFIKYLEDNELHDLVINVKENSNTEYILSFIKDHLEDSEMLSTLSTSIIHDMFKYYIDHK